MSNIIEFEKDFDFAHASNGVGLLDGNVDLQMAKDLPMKDVILQVNAITMSDLIPNVYNAYPIYNWDNTKCVVSTNIVAPVTINLRPGLYGSGEMIANEINKAIYDNLDWWQTSFDPGLQIISDVVHYKIIIVTSGAKLKPIYGNTFNIDFRFSTSGTDLALTLGLSQANAYIPGNPGIPEKVVESDQEPWLDTQGTVADVVCNLVSCRRRNNTRPRTLARIIFAGKNTISDNIWPPAGQVSPYIPYEGNKRINQISVSIKARDGYPMFFLGGYIHVSIGFYYLSSQGIMLPVPLT